MYGWPVAEPAAPEPKIGDTGFIIVVAFTMFIAIVTLLLAVGLSVYADAALADRGQDAGEVTRTSVERLWQGFFAALGALFGLLTGKRF